MGLFDRLMCHDPEFLCSEGHGLGGEEFQTKSLGCTMGYGAIRDRLLTFRDGGWGDATERETPLDVYCTCRQCPAIMPPPGSQTPTAIHPWVEFAVELDGDRVVSISRTSKSTSEYTAEVMLWPHMGGATLMSTAEADAEWERRCVAMRKARDAGIKAGIGESEPLI